MPNNDDDDDDVDDQPTDCRRCNAIHRTGLSLFQPNRMCVVKYIHKTQKFAGLLATLPCTISYASFFRTAVVGRTNRLSSEISMSPRCGDVWVTGNRKCRSPYIGQHVRCLCACVCTRQKRKHVYIFLFFFLWDWLVASSNDSSGRSLPRHSNRRTYTVYIYIM